MTQTGSSHSYHSKSGRTSNRRWIYAAAGLTAIAFAPVIGSSDVQAAEVTGSTDELELTDEVAPAPATEAALLGGIPNVAPPETMHLAPETPPQIAQIEEESEEEGDRFGTRGTGRWYVQGAAATTFDNEFALAGVGVSQFFANGHSINLELNSMGFVQDGEDAAGVNLNLIMRNHLIRKENWSLYIDGGAGILGSTDDVPSGGSSFNFTPQAGVGATVRLNDEERLMVGLRWHHISNANTFDSNPGRDSVMGYVGVNIRAIASLSRQGETLP